jgi:hypothetical protein
MHYEIRPRHVYQRKFDSADLGGVFKGSHWYIISRRPSVRLVPDSLRIEKSVLYFDVVTRESLPGPLVTVSLRLDTSRAGDASKLKSHADGAYFSFAINERLVHGDAWALASLASGAHPLLARQEVMYIGQAFGQGGETNAWHRTRVHEKLQQIYADHAGAEWDVFLTPLALQRGSISSMDHIDDDDDDDDSSGFMGYYDHFATWAGGLRKPAVDLIEHGLISYFRPHYNQKLLKWEPAEPTAAMRKMREIGFRLVHVHLDGWEGLARFYSAEQQIDVRSHFISHDLPKAPMRPALRRVSASRLSTWSLEANLVRHGHRYIAEAAEASGVSLMIFGETAPTIRTPPQVVLPSMRGLRTEDLDRRTWTEAVDDVSPLTPDDRKAFTLPFPFSSQPTYICDGRILLRETIDAPWREWRLHASDCQQVEHGLIIADSIRGRALLDSIAYEAIRSQRFKVWPILLGERRSYGEQLASWSGCLQDPAVTLEAARGVLNRIVGAHKLRSNTGTRRRVALECQASLVVIDGADLILDDPTASELLEEAVTMSPYSHLAVHLAVNDVSSLKRVTTLNRELLWVDNLAVADPPGIAIAAELRMLQEKEQHVSLGSEAFRLAALAGPTGVVVGQVVAAASPELSAEQAKDWATRLLEPTGDILIEWSPLRGSEAWDSLHALSGRMFSLRRHIDAWILVNEYFRSRGLGAESLAEILDGATQVASEALVLSHEPRWARGPSLPADREDAFYATLSHLPRSAGTRLVSVWQTHPQVRLVEGPSYPKPASSCGLNDQHGT